MSTYNVSDSCLVVFSKDRPLQLDAYIASILANSDVRQEQIHVVYVESDSYTDVWGAWPGVTPVPEIGGFHHTLATLVDNLDDITPILWGCDDVVYFRQFSIKDIARILALRTDITGVSLRLGTNIKGIEQLIDTSAEELIEGVTGYSWLTDDCSGHWGYPFELMATAYRAGLVKKILRAGWSFRGPNDFEAIGMKMLQARGASIWRRINRKLRGKLPVPGSAIHLETCRLAILDQSGCCAAQDVNRVQDHAENSVQGDSSQDADALKELYRKGWRFDWQSLDGLVPPDCFIGNDYWELLPPEDSA